MYGMSKPPPPAPSAMQRMPPPEAEGELGEGTLPEEGSPTEERDFGPGLFEQMDFEQFAPQNMTVAELMGPEMGGSPPSSEGVPSPAPSMNASQNSETAMDLLQQRAAERQELSKSFQEKARGMGQRMKGM